MENLDNKESYTLAQTAIQNNIPLGAICLATRVLAHAGVLKDKEATGWNGDNQLHAIYKEHGVRYISDKGVVVDDKNITAQGPDFAKKFGEHIVDMLKQ